MTKLVDNGLSTEIFSNQKIRNKSNTFAQTNVLIKTKTFEPK